MTLLLDSHALLWALHAPAKLEPAALRAIEDGGNAVFFSSASVWEIAIKSGQQLLKVEDGFPGETPVGTLHQSTPSSTS